MTDEAPLRPHPDRLLPSAVEVRPIARRLYEEMRDLPILSPHGHVDARVLLADEPFRDPASLLVTPDHYVTRLLHAAGTSLAELGVGQGELDERASRAAWHALCAGWEVFRGTPVREWFDTELSEIFGVTQRPSATNADALYDQVADCLARDEFRPRALYARFGLEVLASTDDPADDLSAHAALAADPTWTGRMIPTFRPDRYLEPAEPGWPDAVRRLAAAADVDTATYAGYLAALEQRRQHFLAHGATSADHSHRDVRTDRLDDAAATRIYREALGGQASESDTTALRRHLLWEMARMSSEDGLVMTLHPAVHRNHHPATGATYGPDTGHDIPVRAEFTDALQPLLASFGTSPGFQLVVFTIDETTFSREIAPLAGFYPSVFAGVPWWFLDAPDAIGRYLAAVTETAGFSRLSGFVDDTRAFCSIPARHDMFRRVVAGFLAARVTEHRLAEDEAADLARRLVTENPRRAFKL